MRFEGASPLFFTFAAYKTRTMIKELSIQNFRSIREATLQLGRFTVLTGANNSGKSSVLYALQVLKNVVTNPNQSLESLLNLHFLSLGSMSEVVFEKNEKRTLVLGLQVADGTGFTQTDFSWAHSKGTNNLKIFSSLPYLLGCDLPISFPYALNSSKAISTKEPDLEGFVWNGFEAKYTLSPEMPDTIRTRSLIRQVSLPIQALFALDVILTRRGFSKPVFNVQSLNGHIYTEDEVATLLAIDKDLQSKVSYYFEKITGKRFGISIQPGMGFFFMQVREADGSFATELVNQGMGMNQIVFLLAKILYDKNRLICVDEPEIHLHPTLMEQFIRVLVEIAEKEDKQFLFSTHSEHWLMSLLAEVYEEHLAADDLKVYYLQKNEGETTVEQQQVMPNGQIKGGLKNFLEAEMRLAHRFFPVETTA